MSISKTTSKGDFPFLPKRFNTHHFKVGTLKANPSHLSFNVHHPQFAKLATRSQIKALSKDLLHIPIQEELLLMTKDHQLEITVPVLGVVDLLGNEQSHSKVLQIASLVAINGFATSTLKELESYASPEFIVATDMMGNQYEILTHPDGRIELPENGLGRYSWISHLTFIYAHWQLKEGKGLEDLKGICLTPGTLSVSKNFSRR